MPELDQVTYSRDACITAIRDYYEFLTQMYLNPSQVISPPDGGWPSIANPAPGVLEGLGKTDDVISLLAHLPYIANPGDWNNDAHGAAECVLADWQGLFLDLASRSESDAVRVTTEGYCSEDVPAHVIGLTSGGRDNPKLLLDTRLGIIHWPDCPYAVRLDPSREEISNSPDDYSPENEVDWRCDAPAWAIADFFELFKDQFRKLDWIPTSPRTVFDGHRQCGLDEKGMKSMLSDIYREHGWCDPARYRKDDCLAAVRKALEERYPSSVDSRSE